MDDTLLRGTVNVLPVAWLSSCELRPYPSGDLDRARDELADADAVLLRSVTRMTAEHVRRGRRLRAVATLSSGTDHLDREALRAAGIRLFSGRGGNAAAVADWVQWAVQRLAGASGSDGLRGRAAVVVGCGAVGRLVVARLAVLGAEVVQVDPPRAEREPDFQGTEFDAALAPGPALVTLHTPLGDGGPHPTRDLLGASRLAGLRGAVVLNAARGGVMDEQAAAALRRRGVLRGLAIDTFVGEPRPDPQVIAACDLATPHIAGHSIEGKLRVAAQPVRALRAELGLPPAIDLEQALARAAAHPPADRPYQADPMAALDLSAGSLAAEPRSFRAHRAAHWRLELPLAGVERGTG